MTEKSIIFLVCEKNLDLLKITDLLGNRSIPLHVIKNTQEEQKDPFLLNALKIQRTELPTIELSSINREAPVDFFIEPKISFQKKQRLERRRFKK